MLPPLVFHTDGSFRQPGLRPSHAPLDDLPLKPAERRYFDRMERWVVETHEKLRWRSVRIDKANVLETFQVALPRSINEKFTWRKLFDHDPRLPVLIDKIAVKDWLVTERMPLRAPELLWQGTDPDAIPASVLTRRAVMKPAQGWRSQLFLRPGEAEPAEIRAAAAEMLTHRHGWRLFEWGYSRIPPRLLIEEEIVAAPGTRLEEVKVYVFGDRIERIVRLFDRFGTISGQVWDADADGWVQRSNRPLDVAEIIDRAPPPPNWEEMIRAAQQIAAPFDHMRVDLLTDGSRAVLNEMTVYNQGGRMARIGADGAHPATLAWDLRRSWFLRTPQVDPMLEEYRLTLGALLDWAETQV
ncbi:ATP-grasp fold amidoligase family protein [Jannaschia formosa]|uniref:ATP-grasp fold amidoligase family protein n=1 Tax=Jannaschia formosa TaxID=2259592 RepID=UPI000E1B9958|nr:ATP-grasp fold amidoligase family protein [Jannaschia formosa]TFL18855.1 hypothetical protein DR046_08010 [Jannaschia formosa]